ncbi:hypothetical protein [Salinibacter ruber]|uniref:hypothetical protein n=1 Tax=Salinibacter ruber TaxID=146919 RepID=UPI002168C1E9|nr:hypothetical protein [Salinibacter ruber]MCS4136585.1 hypothetical protein [Salinibacter ruber]
MICTDAAETVPTEELAERLFTIAENRPDGTSKATWVELCLVLADRLGAQGRLYKKDAGLSSAVGAISWKEDNSVPAVLSFETGYDRSGGQIRRAKTHIRVGKVVTDATDLSDSLDVDYGTAAEVAAGAETRQELVQTFAEAGASAGAEADEIRFGFEFGYGTYGLDNQADYPNPNQASERSDRKSEVDICFVNPPVGERCNRDQWAALVGRTETLQQQWVALDLIEKARSAHYSSGEDEDDSWVVMGSKKLKDDFKVSYPTSSVYKNCAIIECDGSYISPQQAEELGVDPEAREMRISEDFLQLWTRLGEEGGMRRYKAHRRELVRTRKPQPMSTQLYDENGNDIPDLVEDALKVLRDADHEIMLEAIEEAEEAIAKQEGAEAQHRLTSLRLAKETIERQVIQAQDGVAQLQNAYEIQSISGRVSFKRGGPQGLMGEVKAKAYDIAGYRNFDIKSCHTAALKEVAAILEEFGVEIDVSPWTQYIGKDKVVERTGLPRSLVKVVEHAVKYGAVLPASMKQVKEFYVEDGEDPEDKSNWPSIAREVHEHAEKGLIDDVDEALSTLRDVFADMRRVVIEMAEALLTGYYDANHSGGWMENACGVSFGKHNYSEGHEQRSKVMAWMLQGLEAAFCHHLTILSAESDAFSVVANEHDGLIIRKDTEGEEAFQEALQSAIGKARDRSGFHRADLVEKDFADEDDIEELYGAEAAPDRRESKPEAQTESHAEPNESHAEASEEELVRRHLERKREKRRERLQGAPDEVVAKHSPAPHERVELSREEVKRMRGRSRHRQGPEPRDP